MIIKADLDVKTPSFPNFLSSTSLGGDSNISIDIGRLDEKAFEEFEKQYVVALRKHWASRRKALKI